VTSSAQAHIDLSKLRRVLIVKPSSLGDIVHTLPALHDLKTTFPRLEIKWLANTEWLPLLEGHPQLNGTLEFPRGELGGVKRLWPAMRWMLDLHRQYQPDVTLDFQGLFRSGLISWFSHSRKRLGLTDAREGARYFHNFHVVVDPSSHAVDRYRCMGAALGTDTSLPAVFNLPRGNSLARSLPPNYVAFHPFSRGEGKSLTVSQVSDFCQRVERPVVLLGRLDPLERAQLRLPDSTLDLLNQTTIPELITCLRRAAATISVDSGPMHLATALNPEGTLAIHTWSDPRKVGPYSPNSWVLKGGQIHECARLTADICENSQGFSDSEVDQLITWAHQRVS
jgi:heptosyltransferase-1